jgi:hypothetical protein
MTWNQFDQIEDAERIVMLRAFILEFEMKQ